MCKKIQNSFPRLQLSFQDTSSRLQLSFQDNSSRLQLSFQNNFSTLQLSFQETTMPADESAPSLPMPLEMGSIFRSMSLVQTKPKVEHNHALIMDHLHQRYVPPQIKNKLQEESNETAW